MTVFYTTSEGGIWNIMKLHTTRTKIIRQLKRNRRFVIWYSTIGTPHIEACHSKLNGIIVDSVAFRDGTVWRSYFGEVISRKKEGEFLNNRKQFLSKILKEYKARGI